MGRSFEGRRGGKGVRRGSQESPKDFCVLCLLTGNSFWEGEGKGGGEAIIFSKADN